MEYERFFGSDPEFFISDGKTNDTEFGSIYNIIPPASLIEDLNIPFTTSKNNKRILLDCHDYRFIEDGAAIELNIKSPVNDSSTFYKIMYKSKEELVQFLSAINYKYHKHFILNNNVIAYFDTKLFWENRSESFLDCVRFGCDPDVFPNIYKLSGFEEENCKIIDASKHNFRYAGGHIHVQNMSTDEDVYLNNLEIAPIVFDFFVGTNNILLHRDTRILIQEKGRLRYYGRPGRVRLQKYSNKHNGIEYRPPSNQWLSNANSINVILSSAGIASNIVEKGLAEAFFLTFQSELPVMWDALTNYKVDYAKQLLVNSLTWAIENKVCTISEAENSYGQF